MVSEWPSVSYAAWSDTCDTLHAHTQVLGKIAVALAPPEPQLQHAALQLTARGWETLLLPATNGSGGIVAALDLRTHEAVVEHTDGRVERIALTPDRPVRDVTREVLAAARELAGAFTFDPTPQEVTWTVPLDEDDEHARYDPEHVATYMQAATRAALVLAAFRAPYRGDSTPVNAWWGSFDLAVVLFSGHPAEPPSDDFLTRNSMDAQQFALGWWPGRPETWPPRLLRLRPPCPRRLLRPRAATRRLGRATRRVHPRHRRPSAVARSACRRTRVRPRGLPPRMCRLQLGHGPRGHRRRRTAADSLAPKAQTRSQDLVPLDNGRLAHHGG